MVAHATTGGKDGRVWFREKGVATNPELITPLVGRSNSPLNINLTKEK